MTVVRSVLLLTPNRAFAVEHLVKKLSAQDRAFEIRSHSTEVLPEEAWGFSPTKNAKTRSGFSPGAPIATLIARAPMPDPLKVHPEGACRFTPTKNGDPTKLHPEGAWGFSPTKNAKTKRGFSPGAPIATLIPKGPHA